MNLNISGLERKVPGYVLLQLPWKIPQQAGFGPAAQPPCLGNLGNHFCSALLFLWQLASADISLLLVSTGHFPILYDKSESF